ncbi:MAG TPA: hypothetical protein VET30_04920, partial [Pseudoxanthomonas sp.]|nr:hypothetical protein [Pseudoxanthomonas sp.]
MRDRQPQVRDAGFEVVEEAGSGARQLAFIAFDEFVFEEPRHHRTCGLIGRYGERLDFALSLFRHFAFEVAKLMRQT